MDNCVYYPPLSITIHRELIGDDTVAFELAEDNSRADLFTSNLSMKAAHWKHRGFVGFMDDYGNFCYFV